MSNEYSIRANDQNLIAFADWWKSDGGSLFRFPICLFSVLKY